MISITNIDLGNVILADARFDDDTLTFAAAGTVAEGTILARDSVSGNLVPYVQGGSTNENGIPKTILTYDVTATAAGNIPIRAPIFGKFRLDRAIIAADGDNSNVTKAVIDQLRDFAIILKDVEELYILDNQP